VPPITGATLIGAERERHLSEEGYTPEHDAQHVRGELPWAAFAVLDAAAGDAVPDGEPPQVWPWGEDRWPSTQDPLRLLVIAGSFVAAEIDRRLLEQGKGVPE
jgi:hypothetical protein